MAVCTSLQPETPADTIDRLSPVVGQRREILANRKQKTAKMLAVVLLMDHL